MPWRKGAYLSKTQNQTQLELLHSYTLEVVGVCEHVPACARRWAGQQGQDFIANHNIPAIDFAAFHSWVDNWLDDDITFQQNWIRQHAADAAAIGKPVHVLSMHKYPSFSLTPKYQMPATQRKACNNTVLLEEYLPLSELVPSEALGRVCRLGDSIFFP